MGGMPDPKDETRYSHVAKIIADVPMKEVENIINQIEGQEVRDIRKTAWTGIDSSTLSYLLLLQRLFING